MSLVGSSELPTGPVNITAAGIADGGGHAGNLKATHELALHSRLRHTPHGAPNGVDVHPTAATIVEFCGEEIGAPSMVIHVFDEGVLNRNPATGLVKVVSGSVERFVNLPSGVDGNELVAQFVVGCM